MSEELITCAVDGCDADERGTQNGGAPMLCRGYGSWRPECMVNWMSCDPEDLGTYADYLREVLPQAKEAT